jgi:carbonic anhydrase/acetyltransferase-like protein (isoleucine patch superfamily)
MLLPYDGVQPRLGRDVFIAPGAAVIGDVVLGDSASIWFGAVVRGDMFPIRIGARSNIQDGSVVHVTTGLYAVSVGDDVTVGHRVILHGCTVEDGALIGMGAIVMDRAVIGRGALVAAGSLVPEGMVVPPGMVAMGSPAKVKRAVTEAEREYLVYAAQHYAEVAARYAAQLAGGAPGQR